VPGRGGGGGGLAQGGLTVGQVPCPVACRSHTLMCAAAGSADQQPLFGCLLPCRKSTWGGEDPPVEGDSVVVPTGGLLAALAPGLRGAGVSCLGALCSCYRRRSCSISCTYHGQPSAATAHHLPVTHTPLPHLALPAGTFVLLDVSPPRLYALVIEGGLAFDPATAEQLHLQVRERVQQQHASSCMRPCTCAALHRLALHHVPGVMMNMPHPMHSHGTAPTRPCRLTTSC
jgi:hypothetical protein